MNEFTKICFSACSEEKVKSGICECFNRSMKFKSKEMRKINEEVFWENRLRLLCPEEINDISCCIEGCKMHISYVCQDGITPLKSEEIVYDNIMRFGEFERISFKYDHNECVFVSKLC